MITSHSMNQRFHESLHSPSREEPQDSGVLRHDFRLEAQRRCSKDCRTHPESLQNSPRMLHSPSRKEPQDSGVLRPDLRLEAQRRRSDHYLNFSINTGICTLLLELPINYFKCGFSSGHHIRKSLAAQHLLLHFQVTDRLLLISCPLISERCKI